MPRGLSPCKWCGKLVPSLYKRHHETRLCKKKFGKKTLSPFERKHFRGPLDEYLEREEINETN